MVSSPGPLSRFLMQLGIYLMTLGSVKAECADPDADGAARGLTEPGPLGRWRVASGQVVRDLPRPRRVLEGGLDAHRGLRRYAGHLGCEVAEDAGVQSRDRARRPPA